MKRIKLVNAVLIGSILVLSVTFINKFKQFNSTRQRNDIDSLANLLHSFDPEIKHGATIGFISDTSAGKLADLHFKVSFVLAPIIVADGFQDTMVALSVNHQTPKTPSGYHVIKNVSLGRFKARLICVNND
ncbi:hypothetical protein [Dyadobacter sandarakinus]|uniref:Uncharacterized protein n=1 Tax=Dyadobacter sandarakinus TaxID=2747268 RepID=A0ABX7I1Z7_9BACT|nr:hypothetical protein [Dyadobacter sandarakinus]QRQ99799.1 hypothetical protein HWI92_02125 [Dyadobacter sandarakinus]